MERRELLRSIGVLLSTTGIEKFQWKNSLIESSSTVGNIIEAFIREVPSGRLAETVDTLKAGKMDSIVTGITTTMFPTIEIIKKSIDLGHNFIICHEPTYYNHLDTTDWLENNKVYLYKKELLSKNNIAVWRNHDYIHRLKPDPIVAGLIKQLGWENVAKENELPNLLKINPQSLKSLINHIKTSLKIPKVRFIGDLNQKISKIAVVPGFAGRNRQIAAINDYGIELLICGEISEWETAEYVRDARSKGVNVALVLLGHSVSEEIGSIFMAEWIKKEFPETKVQFISSGSSLQFE